MEPAVNLADAATTPWDIAFIGAGPAGSSAACGLASSGFSILLIDKSPFPRWKVCGFCLNPSALAFLEHLGLADLPQQLHARPLSHLRLASGGRSALIPLSGGGGVSLSREALDNALVRHAVSRATFNFSRKPMPNSPPAPGSGARTVLLQHGDEHATIHAKLVLAADGLGGHLLDDVPELGEATEIASRMGAGTVLHDAPASYRDGTIFMACGRGGYVGLVRLEDGRLDIAAAVDPLFVKQCTGPARAVSTFIQTAGLPPIDHLDQQPWRGTPKLTRRRPHLGAERLLVLGDAAGYVEPFTGEGIAWALASGIAIAPLAAEAVRSWSHGAIEQWESTHTRLLGSHQFACRMVTRMLRHPSLTRAAVAALSLAPALAMPVVRAVASPLLHGQ